MRCDKTEATMSVQKRGYVPRKSSSVIRHCSQKLEYNLLDYKSKASHRPTLYLRTPKDRL